MQELEKHLASAAGRPCDVGEKNITGPCDLWDLQRKRRASGAHNLEGFETDVFLWAKGEASDPRMTRLGGQPWRKLQAQWPVGVDGSPLPFVGQLSGADSKCPYDSGDMVLLFGRFLHETYLDLSSIHLEWSSSTRPGHGVVSGPTTGRDYYGVLLRTMDYPLLVAEGLGAQPATKFGGIPRRSQDCEWPEGFVGQFASFQAHCRSEWPLVNRRQMRKEEVEHHELMIGDMKVLSVYADKDGLLSWSL